MVSSAPLKQLDIAVEPNSGFHKRGLGGYHKPVLLRMQLSLQSQCEHYGEKAVASIQSLGTATNQELIEIKREISGLDGRGPIELQGLWGDGSFGVLVKDKYAAAKIFQKCDDGRNGTPLFDSSQGNT